MSLAAQAVHQGVVSPLVHLWRGFTAFLTALKDPYYNTGLLEVMFVLGFNYFVVHRYLTDTENWLGPICCTFLMINYMMGVWHDRGDSNFIPLAFATCGVVMKKEVLLRSMVFFGLVCCALFGQLHYYYAFLLFDILFTNEIMRNLLKAITKPGKQLMYTGVLIVIVIYTFGICAFFLFEKRYLNFELENDVSTFFFQTLYNVMVPGPAMGIMNKKEFYQRFVFDVGFYIIMVLVLLNIIFGIIIDTFGALRDETQTRQDHLNNYCFICNLSNGVIDHAATKVNADAENHMQASAASDGMGSKGKMNHVGLGGGNLAVGKDCGMAALGSDPAQAAAAQTSGKDKVVYDHNKPHQGFLQHTRHEHDVWNYVFFIFHINSKDPTTYTGPEQTIRDMLANEDIGWFPIERSTLLERADMSFDHEGVHGHAGDTSGADASMAGIECILTEIRQDLSQLKESGNGKGRRGGA